MAGPSLDLVTSGRSVVSLACRLDDLTTVPSARIGTANFAGSGYLVQCGITSGAAALVLAGNPVSLLIRSRRACRQPTLVRLATLRRRHGALNAYAAVTSGPRTSTVAPTCPHSARHHGLAVAHSPRRTHGTELWSGITWNQGIDWCGDWNGWAWGGAELERLDLDQPGLEQRELSGAAWNGEDWDSRAGTTAAGPVGLNGAAWAAPLE